jgi:uncharacterized protein YgbK (DUF1537 family)
MRLRLVADDLTGALDTAAQFVASTGPVPVFWTHPAADTLPPTVAIDSGTREQQPAMAAAVAAELAAVLAPAPDVIAFKKLDSLLRGHCGRELAACLRSLPVRHCIIAPAFPFQGRVTRMGRQYAGTVGGWQQVGEALGETLAREGIHVTPAHAGDAVPTGTSLWDAETDEDLRRIAQAGLALESHVLWCGSSGLAGALAGLQAPVSATLARPVVGLFGSDHPVTQAQLRAAAPHHVVLPDGGAVSAARLSALLGETGVALAGFDLPDGLARQDAAARIAQEMDALTRRIARPRTLLIAGGETLRALCIALGATRLDVFGQIIPGVPRSIMRGGRWDGVDVVSKSGAFGTTDLLRWLVVGPLKQPEGTVA